MLRAEDNQAALYEYLAHQAQEAEDEHQEWLDENFPEVITGCEPEQEND